MCQEAVGGGRVLGEEVIGAGAERVEARSRATNLLMLNKWEAPESGLKPFGDSMLCVSLRNDSLNGAGLIAIGICSACISFQCDL